MRLEIANAIGVDVRVRERFNYSVGLAVDAGRSVAGLLRAVVVDGRAFDDGANGVAIGKGIAEPL